MKQLTKLGMLLTIGALAVSCSNDNKVDNPNNTIDPDYNGKAYMSVSIAMPNTDYSRAASYVDGEEEEYAATSGTVYLFKRAATGEADYTYVTKGTISQPLWEMSSDNQVTTNSKTAVAEFTGFEAGLDTDSQDEYSILVVLNDNLTAPTAPQGSNDGQKFGDWKLVPQSNVLGNLTNGLTMTNAPEFKNGSVKTLVDIDKSKISTSPTNLSPAATVYVQRIAAKVSIGESDEAKRKNNTLADFKVELPEGADPGTTPDHVKFSHWDINYYNTTSYPVQVADDYQSWLTAGTGTTANDQGTLGRYLNPTGNFGRIHWGYDPNYVSVSKADNNHNTTDALSVINGVNTDNVITKTVTYINENTMEYNKQQYDQTTTVVLKGTYHIENSDQEDSFVTYGAWRSKIPDSLKEKLTATTGAKNTSLVGLFEGAEEDEVLEAFGLTSDVNVNYYHEGVVYYSIQIRHFDDLETPKPVPMVGISSYLPSHRGRYGVLRNNWYEVNVNSITGLGDPSLPDPDDPDDPTPDDDPDKQYIQVTINILKWAKRSYDYDL